jgi:penicillin amidase
MARETSRRAFVGALVAGGVGGVAGSSAGDLLESFAPLSGRAWRSTRGSVPDRVSSPHGDATVTYDDYGVPHVEADSEAAAYYAVGFVQAADRLFEMDLVRRLMDGRLAAAIGERAVESDVFHAKMDFRGAAEASFEALSGSRVEGLTAAYADGVNAYLDSTGRRPVEFALAGYEANPWTPLDSLLVGTRISWGLTGSFRELRRSVLRDRLGEADYRRLYEAPYDHGAPIIRDGTSGTVSGVGGRDRPSGGGRRNAVDPAFVEYLSGHEPPQRWGSNHWAVGGEHTDSGSPILAYDPHLSLMAPPVWYEQRITVGDLDVRGATFPGIPFVIVGENRHGAWGFTNTGADVVDHYTYETDGDRYRYRGEWRAFESERRTIAVADGADREVEVRKTVHGPFLDREVDGESRHVGVAWTGTSGTRESEAIYELSRTRNADEFAAALRSMDVPTQNALYVDDDEILYRVTGRIPIRRDDDGAVIRGDRVFDGSAGAAEWDGFEPFGQSDWTGFVPFEALPGVRDPDYIGTANQRVADDPLFPVGQAYASGFRGLRVYERLDDRVASEAPVDPAFMASLQNDTLDVRARLLVPAILDARDRIDDRADGWLDALADWDYRMEPDSAAALFFDRFYEAFREATWRDDFDALDLDDGWWPQEWPLVTLPPDDPFFDGDRAGVIAEAATTAVEVLEANDWAVYGDRHRTTIDHPFGDQVPALNYPRYPVGGTDYTVFNVHVDAERGSSWRQISPMDGDSRSIIPGGQDGSPFSAHYDDQLRAWADGEYKPMAFETPADGDTIAFEAVEE